MRRVRVTTVALGLFVSIAVVPALPASASGDDLNRCTQAKVVMHPVYYDRPTALVGSIRVYAPERRCEPAAGLAARPVEP